MIPTVEEMIRMTPEDLGELHQQVQSPEEAGELLKRTTEATRRRFGLKGPIVDAFVERFWQICMLLPYRLAPDTKAPDWSPLGDPRLLKVESWLEYYTIVTLNGHPEWSNQQVIEAEMAERQRLNAPAKDAY